jgi:hypothetical protein
MTQVRIQSSASSTSIRNRTIAFAVLMGCSALFATAATLTPSPTGYGTHQQLGSPPCLMPLLMGLPCPTCGMTTSFAYAARGHLMKAFHAQPAGLAIALTLACFLLISVRVLWTGDIAFLQFRPKPIRTALLVGGVLLAGWAYKIMTFTL